MIDLLFSQGVLYIELQSTEDFDVWVPDLMLDLYVRSRAGLRDGPSSLGSGSTVTIGEKTLVCASTSSFGGLGASSQLKTDLMLTATLVTAGQWRAMNLTHRKHQRTGKKRALMWLPATSTSSTQALLTGHSSIPGAGTLLVLIFKISVSNTLQNGLFIFSC